MGPRLLVPRQSILEMQFQSLLNFNRILKRFKNRRLIFQLRPKTQVKKMSCLIGGILEMGH